MLCCVCVGGGLHLHLYTQCTFTNDCSVALPSTHDCHCPICIQVCNVHCLPNNIVLNYYHIRSTISIILLAPHVMPTDVQRAGPARPAARSDRAGPARGGPRRATGRPGRATTVLRVEGAAHGPARGPFSRAVPPVQPGRARPAHSPTSISYLNLPVFFNKGQFFSQITTYERSSIQFHYF